MNRRKYINHDPRNLARLAQSQLYDVIEPIHVGTRCKILVTDTEGFVFVDDNTPLAHIENLLPSMNAMIYGTINNQGVFIDDMQAAHNEAPLSAAQQREQMAAVVAQLPTEYQLTEQHPIAEIAQQWRRVVDGEIAGLRLINSAAPHDAPRGLLTPTIERELICVATSGCGTSRRIVGAIYMSDGMARRRLTEIATLDAPGIDDDPPRFGRVFTALFNIGGAKVAPCFHRWRDDLTPEICQGGNHVG